MTPTTTMMKFKEGDQVRITYQANYEGWYFREGDEAEVIGVFPFAHYEYHIKFTKIGIPDHMGHVASCNERHIELISRPGEKKGSFDHAKDRAQIANAKIDWFQLNEEFSSK